MLTLISHNNADKNAAREIAIYLAADSIPFWFDEWEIKAGDSIVGKVEEALSSCSHFLLLWSNHSSRSDWVRRELRAALANAIETESPRIVPVKLDDAQLPELLRDIRYIRYRGGSEVFRTELIQAITGRPASANLIRAIVKKYHEVIRSSERGSTFGLAACPRCGSDLIEPSTDWIVDGDYSDGQATWSGVEVPMVRCTECAWQANEDEIEDLKPSL